MGPEAVCCSGVTCLLQFSLERLFVRLQGRVGKSATIKETAVDLERQMGQYNKWMCGDLINWLI